MKKHLEDIKEILEDTNFQLGQKLNEVGEQYGADSEEFIAMKGLEIYLSRRVNLLKNYSDLFLSKFINK